MSLSQLLMKRQSLDKESSSQLKMYNMMDKDVSRVKDKDLDGCMSLQRINRSLEPHLEAKEKFGMIEDTSVRRFMDNTERVMLDTSTLLDQHQHFLKMKTTSPAAVLRQKMLKHQERTRSDVVLEAYNLQGCARPAKFSVYSTIDETTKRNPCLSSFESRRSSPLNLQVQQVTISNLKMDRGRYTKLPP